MVKRSDMILGILFVLAVFIFFSKSREFMTDPPHTMQMSVDPSKSTTDGTITQVHYQYSGQDPNNDAVTATIKTIEYWKAGQKIGEQTPPDAQQGLNSGGAGTAVFNIPPPSGLDVSGLEYITITTYVSTKPKGKGGVDTKRSVDKRAKVNASVSA